MARSRQSRRRSTASVELPQADLEPLVQRTLNFLENSPRGASRVDILSAMNLQPGAWPALRKALEDTGDVLSVGRGPGLRHVHVKFKDQIPPEVAQAGQTAERSARLQDARKALQQVLKDKGEIDSAEAQEATGLKADPVRRLLLELVDKGQVERSGKKRSTRYKWVG